jgi:threonine aldolase
VRELQNCAEFGNVSQDQAFEKLRNENHYLRKQLVDVQSKLTRLTETLQTLAGSLSNALHECPAAETKNIIEVGLLPDSSGRSLDSTTAHKTLDPTICSLPSANELLVPFEPFTMTPSMPNNSRVSPGLVASCQAFDWQSVPDDINCLFPQIPNIWSHEYQMGLQPYTKALSESSSSSLILGKPWIETNSPFSDHIFTLRDLMKTSIGQIGGKYQQQERYTRSFKGLSLFS